jgi:hypothetical protein
MTQNDDTPRPDANIVAGQQDAAFPAASSEELTKRNWVPGLTKLEHFASQALPATINNYAKLKRKQIDQAAEAFGTGDFPTLVAELAFRIGQAMLEKSKQHKNGRRNK